MIEGWGPTRKYMTRAECERVILRLMADGRSITISEIREVTGCHRDTIGGIVKGQNFEEAGKRMVKHSTHNGGALSTLYRLRTPDSQATAPDPLGRPLDPSLMQAMGDHVDTGHMIGVWARRGDKARAVEMLAMWWQEDARIKELCR